MKIKKCPFCGTRAIDSGGMVTSCHVSIVRCSNRDCLASFKSVDAATWNSRAAPAPDTAQLDLLMRRFCTSPAGALRDAARTAVVDYVAESAT